MDKKVQLPIEYFVWDALYRRGPQTKEALQRGLGIKSDRLDTILDGLMDKKREHGRVQQVGEFYFLPESLPFGKERHLKVVRRLKHGGWLGITRDEYGRLVSYVECLTREDLKDMAPTIIALAKEERLLEHADSIRTILKCDDFYGNPN